MSTAQKAQSDSKYYKIIQGSFRLKAFEGAEGAIHRTWEAKGDRPAGETWEYPFEALYGTIENIYFHKGEFGRNLQITLDRDEDGVAPVISAGVETKYGESLLKILPALEKGVEYRFFPYDFATKEDPTKKKTGVSVSKKDEEGEYTVKVMSPFFGPDQTYLEGYPEPTEEDKQDWKFYFLKANKFMVKYAEEKVLPRFTAETGGGYTYPENTIAPEDIGF